MTQPPSTRVAWPNDWRWRRAPCGLGSCIATLKDQGPDAAKQLLGIPSERRARTVVTIGHTDTEARRALPKAAQARKPITEFAHWDRY